MDVKQRVEEAMDRSVVVKRAADEQDVGVQDVEVRGEGGTAGRR
jgi:hypothetical protein